MIYLQIFLMVIWLVFCCLLGIFRSLFRWGDLNLNRDFGRMFAHGCLKITRVKVNVLGLENLEAEQPCIYVANHQSAYDLVSFGSAYPRRTIIIGKKELKWMPFFGVLYMAGGNILIDRQKQHKAFESLFQALEAIRERKASIWIFPEGTRNRTGYGLLPFKKGAFYLAIEAGVPIVPLLSSSLKPVISWKEKRIDPGTVEVRILPPISTAGMTTANTEQLMELVHQRMSEALRGLSTRTTEASAC